MKYKMKFLDFCAGIGGGRLGLEKADPLFSCIGYSEIDKEVIKTYQVLHEKDETNYGDLMKIDLSILPNFEVMIAGFPCQTFSVIGLRGGFDDERGKIIYGLLKILKGKNVPFFIFENVKGLSNHNNGESITHIIEELKKIGYHVEWKILNSINYGVPQMRERIYFVGIRQDIYNRGKQFNWNFDCIEKNVADYLIDTDNSILNPDDFTFQKYLNNQYNFGKFDLEKILLEDYLVLDTRQSDLRLYKNKIPTLRKGRHGVLYVKDGKLKKLSGYEGLLLQGFPKEYALKAKEKIPDKKLLSQVGNAMTVSTIEFLGKKLMEYVNNLEAI